MLIFTSQNSYIITHIINNLSQYDISFETIDETTIKICNTNVLDLSDYIKIFFFFFLLT